MPRLRFFEKLSKSKPDESTLDQLFEKSENKTLDNLDIELPDEPEKPKISRKKLKPSGVKKVFGDDSENDSENESESENENDFDLADAKSRLQLADADDRVTEKEEKKRKRQEKKIKDKEQVKQTFVMECCF